MQKNKKCIIYTRVARAEQLHTNNSLEAQIKYCEEFAHRKGFTEIKHMGGIAESANNQNRETYRAMLNYALDKRNGIEAIIVYSFDRFSRYLASAVTDIEKLKRKNILLYSVQGENENSKNDLGMLLINFKLNSSL